MKWIREHKKLVIIGLTLVLLLGLATASFAARGRSSWLGRAADTVISAVQKPVSAVGDVITDFVRSIGRANELQAENEQLKAQIAQLNRDLLKEKMNGAERSDLQALRTMLNSNHLTEEAIVTTRVTALDRSDWFSTLTIGAGAKDGVRKNDAVLAADGLIGRVMEVGPGWAKVVAIIHDSQRISFRTASDLEQVGILSGTGDGTLNGYLLDIDAHIEVGEHLVTSGMELYPEGIAIGEVTSISVDPDSDLIYVTVNPTANFQKVRTVSVILSEEE